MLLAIALIVLTGYILYKVLRHPVKTIKVLGALLCLFMMGFAVWLSIFALVLNT